MNKNKVKPTGRAATEVMSQLDNNKFLCQFQIMQQEIANLKARVKYLEWWLLGIVDKSAEA